MPEWNANSHQQILEICYGIGSHHPQYAALHLDSGYFRLVYGEESGWGTSVSLLPCLWTGGRYYQGAAVQAKWQPGGADLMVSITGEIGGLSVEGEVRIGAPDPSGRSAVAEVSMRCRGDVTLDRRPN